MNEEVEPKWLIFGEEMKRLCGKGRLKFVTRFLEFVKTEEDIDSSIEECLDFLENFTSLLEQLRILKRDKMSHEDLDIKKLIEIRGLVFSRSFNESQNIECELLEKE